MHKRMYSFIRSKLESVISVVVVVSVMAISPTVCSAENQLPTGQWDNPFINLPQLGKPLPDSLGLVEALSLVARDNLALQASLKRIRASEGLIVQAGLRPNPVLGIGTEDFGGNISGFGESETSVTLSQEFDFWGKRGGRKNLAKAESKEIQLEALLTAFGVHATTVERFSRVVHAQLRVTLSIEALGIAREIVESTRLRVNKGATLKSELLFSELEFERAEMNLYQAEAELKTAKTQLSSLWGISVTDFSVKQSSDGLQSFPELEQFRALLNDSREIHILNYQKQTLTARLNLAKTDSRPGITFSGGVKRLESINATTFIFGAGIPLPLFNRNQGLSASLRTSSDALRLEKELALINAKATFETIQRQIALLVSRYTVIEDALLPKTEEMFNTLKIAYSRGRIPYSLLLEAQRKLINLRFELNDINLSIRQEIISLELLLGVIIN